MGAVEKATVEAEKHGDRSSEKLSSLVAEAREMIAQAETEQAERARAAAEEATAVKAAAAKRERLAALALEVQQLQAELGGGSGTPDAEETMCVLCLDAPKDHIITPCGHQCVCGVCAEKLKRVKRPTCPICREPIAATFKVFVA